MALTFLSAGKVRCQFECTWRKDKSPQNQARLCKQIARCNSLVNKDKSNYYRNLASENTQDCVRSYVQHYIPIPKVYSLLISQRGLLLIVL